MKRLSLLPLLLPLVALSARPVAAQAVLDDPKLDSIQLVVRDALYRLRDSLTLVDAATARIQRDLRTTSDEVLRTRARNVATRCAATAATIPETREAVRAHPMPQPDPRGVLGQLDRALTELEGRMNACRTDFEGLATPDKAAELRDYGVGRGAKVRGASHQYQPAVVTYFKVALGVRYMPAMRGGVPEPIGRAPGL